MPFKFFALPFSPSHLNFLEQRLRDQSKSQDDLRHSRGPASYQIKGSAAHFENIFTFLFALALFLRDLDALPLHVWYVWYTLIPATPSEIEYKHCQRHNGPEG